MNKFSTSEARRRRRTLLAENTKPRSLNLWDLLHALRRQVVLIVGVALLCLATTVYVLLNTTPTYSTFAQILLGEQGLTDQNSFDLVEAQALTSSIIEGEIAIMRSNKLLARVVRKLSLDEDPEFNPNLREISPPNPAVVWLKATIKTILGMGPEDESVEATPGPVVNEEILQASSTNKQSMGEISNVVDGLRNDLFIRQQGNSSILSVQMTSENPQKAAAITNTVMDQYINFLADKRFQAARRFTSWLEGRVEELAVKLEASEREVLAFRAVMEADADSTIRLEQQMRELTTKLVNAGAELAEAEARARRAMEINAAEGPLATANVLANDTILQFRRDLSELRQEEATATRNFSADSRQVQSIRRAIAKIESDIAAEIENLILQLTNRVETLSINVAALKHNLSSFEGLNMQRSNEQIRLNQLQRIADANRKVYEEFLGRYKQTSEFQNLQSSDAEVISYASPPGVPSYPRKTVASVLALFGGLGIGAALALFLEMRAKTLSSTRQVSEETGMAVFGAIPHIGRRATASGLLKSLAQTSASGAAQAGVILSNNVNLHTDTTFHAVFVTSCDANMGKTLTAVLLAWATVKSGKTCILVDGDIRTARLSRDLKVTQNAYFLPAVYGKRSLQDCIVRDLNIGFDFIGTQNAGVDPSIIYNAGQTQAIIATLKKTYDVVIIDAPALENASDSFVTPGSQDLGIFTIPARKVLLRNIAQSLSIFENLNLRDTGLVLTGST